MLLERLALPFSCESPDIDESPLPMEAPQDMVKRLALQKAMVSAKKYPDSIIIGSDQVGVLDYGEKDVILTKPSNHKNAIAQLSQVSGKEVIFLNGLCVFNVSTGAKTVECTTFTVNFRLLQTEEIERYLLHEKPYDSAGCLHSEGLGIALLDRMQGEDPTALIGLPLIRISELLRKEGLSVP